MQFCKTSRIPCNVTASHWCLIFYRISLNLFDVSFYFISWHHELSAALGTLQLKVHSRSDDMHGIASARVRLFHSQNISRTNIHVPFHPFHLTCSQINHEYILLYPIFLHKAIFSRDIFCICTKAIKDTAQIRWSSIKISDVFENVKIAAKTKPLFLWMLREFVMSNSCFWKCTS